MERLYVAESAPNEFVEKFVARTNALRIGTACDYSDEVSSLATEKQLKTVTAHVEDAVAKGVTVLAGGTA